MLYCQPADGMLDCKGPLSGTIAPNILAEVNEEVKLAAASQKKKHGSHLSQVHTQEKVRVVQYSSINGIRAAVLRFIHGSLDSKDIRQ